MNAGAHHTPMEHKVAVAVKELFVPSLAHAAQTSTHKTSIIVLGSAGM